MQKITPLLWFDNNAEEAVKFYTKIFKKSKMLQIARYGDAADKEDRYYGTEIGNQ